MTFVIEPIPVDTFWTIYTPAVAAQLNKLTYHSDNWATDESLRRLTWAIDKNKKACLVWVHMADRLDCNMCYAFVMEGEFALIREEDYCLYSFTTISPGLLHRMDEVKALIAEALRIGGEWLEDRTKNPTGFAVPNAQFINN